MNIIKLKDQIMPTTNPNHEYFNKYLKGKYAYWVQTRYIVSFEHLRHEGYIACEEDITKLLKKEDGSYPKPYGAPYVDVYESGIMKYVDTVETDRINNIDEFKIKNSYTSDDDITIDELKKFRSWLAATLLKMDQNESGEQKYNILNSIETHLLQYYANDMYDEIIKGLTDFSSSSISLSSVNTSTCGCQNSNINSLYGSNLSICDPIAIYRNNVYNKMVELFSNYSFWAQWAPEFINEFKKYIDNIINCDFILSKTTWVDSFVDCVCQDKQTQDNFLEILKNLSMSLGYIRDNQINGHKNYINDSLLKWAQMLYENMSW